MNVNVVCVCVFVCLCMRVCYVCKNGSSHCHGLCLCVMCVYQCLLLSNYIFGLIVKNKLRYASSDTRQGILGFKLKKRVACVWSGNKKEQKNGVNNHVIWLSFEKYQRMHLLVQAVHDSRTLE